MVILICFTKKKSKFNLEERKVQYSTKNGGLWLENSTNLHFQYYTELFFLEFKFWFFFAGQLRVTIEDYCISLNPNNFFLVVLGVVDMCHDLLKRKPSSILDWLPGLKTFAWTVSRPSLLQVMPSSKHWFIARMVLMQHITIKRPIQRKSIFSEKYLFVDINQTLLNYYLK